MAKIEQPAETLRKQRARGSSQKKDDVKDDNEDGSPRLTRAKLNGLKLTFVLNEEERVDDLYQVTSLATVTDADDNFQEGISLGFYQNTKRLDTVETNEDGQAEYTFAEIKPNTTYNVEVVVLDDNGKATKKRKKANKPIRIKQDTKRPKTIECQESEIERGKYDLFITVLADDNSPISKIPVQIVDFNSSNLWPCDDTDKNGRTVVRSVQVPPDKDRLVLMVTAGSVTETISLYA